MLKFITFFLVLISAVVSITRIDTKCDLINSQQVQILNLFKNVYQYDDYFHNEDNDTSCKLFKKFYYFKSLLKKGDIFSPFDTDHISEIKVLTKLFGEHLNTLTWTRNFANEGMHIFLSHFVLLTKNFLNGHRLPPIYEINPYLFLKRDVIHKAQKLKMTHVATGHTIVADKKDDEIDDYYRRDVDLNAYYYYFNIKHLNPLDDSRTLDNERVTFFRKQLIARYNLERYSNDLPLIDNNNKNYLKPKLDSKLKYENGNQFEFKVNVDTEICDYLYGYDRPLYVSLQAKYDFCSERGSNGRHFDHFETTLIDPNYYQKQSNLLQQFEQPNVNISDILNDNISILDVTVTRLTTKFESSEFDITNAVYLSETERKMDSFKLYYRQTRLTHYPFKINITVQSKIETKSNRQHFFQIDQFLINLDRGENVIARNSSEAYNTVRNLDRFKDIEETLKTNTCSVFEAANYWKFPNRLLLPRGKTHGQYFIFLVHIGEVDPKMEFIDDNVDNYYSMKSNPLNGNIIKELDDYNYNRHYYSNQFHPVYATYENFQNTNFYFKDVLIRHQI